VRYYNILRELGISRRRGQRQLEQGFQRFFQKMRNKRGSAEHEARRRLANQRPRRNKTKAKAVPVSRPSRIPQRAGAAAVVSALLLLSVVPSAHALPAALVLLLSVLLLSVLLFVPLLLLLVFAIGRRARALFRPASVVTTLVCSSHISVAADSTDGLQERATEGSSEVAEATRDEDSGRECILARCPEPVEEGSTGGTGLGAAASVDCGRTTPPVALPEAASASREPRRRTRRHKAPTLGDMVSP
jgi:hypothetical protein